MLLRAFHLSYTTVSSISPINHRAPCVVMALGYSTLETRVNGCHSKTHNQPRIKRFEVHGRKTIRSTGNPMEDANNNQFYAYFDQFR